MPKAHTVGPLFRYYCASCGEDILPGQEYRRAGKKKHHLRPDCAHAKAVAATELPTAPDESEVHYHEKNRTRLLRCYSGVARVDHDCYECSTSRYVNQQMVSTIFVGEHYDAEVWVVRGMLEVRFFHDSCPFDPHEEDLRLREEEEEFEDGWDDEAMPIAA
jgi:hypothetical protein